MKLYQSLAACLIAGLGTLGQAGAATVSYDLNLNNLGGAYTGQTLARVTLSDTSTGVDFTVTALLAGTRLDDFAFNLNGDVEPDGFSVVGSSLPTGWTSTVAINSITGFNGFQKFDVGITGNGAANRTSPLTFSVTGGTVDSYLALSTSKGEPVFFSAHVTDLTAAGLTGFAGGSAPVPVPAAAWLLGSGLLGLVGVARRKTA